jgi:hypothetical protein
MTLQVEPDTPEQEVIRLRHELQHLIEQCQVSHGMAMSWKVRALDAEEQVRRLQHKVDRLRAKQDQPLDKKVKPIDPADQRLNWEMEHVVDAKVPV